MIPEGTYPAVATAASVWESEKGALMITFQFALDAGDPINGSQCIVQKDGTISEITVNTLKKCFAWDGLDPFWLEDPANLADKPVDLVIEHEEWKGKPRAHVRYINAPGDGIPASADRKKVLAKYGARFRALSGGATVATPPKRATPPPPPAPKVVAPPRPTLGAGGGPTATMEEAWAVLCDAEKASGKDRDELADLWSDAIGSLMGDKPQSDFTPQDWGRLASHFADDLPY